MPKKTASKKINKSAFVRGLPATMPAKEVVEKAKAQGANLSVAYVYSIRNAAKVAAKKTSPAVVAAPAATPARRGRPPKAISSNGGSSSSTRVEDLLRAVAAELGLSRAIGLLQTEQQKVRAVIGG